MVKNLFWLLAIASLAAAAAPEMKEAWFFSFELTDSEAVLIGYAAGQAQTPDYAVTPFAPAYLTVELLNQGALVREIKLPDPRVVYIEYYDNEAGKLVSNVTRLHNASLKLVLPAGDVDAISVYDSAGQKLALLDLTALNLVKPKRREFDLQLFLGEDKNRDLVYWIAVIVLVIGALSFLLGKRR